MWAVGSGQILFQNLSMFLLKFCSGLDISRWRQLLVGYSDYVICDFLEFGFPLDVHGEPVVDGSRNHKSAREFSSFIDDYMERETKVHRLVGPFVENPLSVNLVVFPINTVPKDEVDRLMMEFPRIHIWEK